MFVFWWLTSRGGDQCIRCESRQVDQGAYELKIMMADGSERIEHFADSVELEARQDALTKEFEAQGWSAHGWNL